MRTHWTAALRTLALAAVLGIPLLQSAASQEVAESEDPPDRVARLSYRLGDVSLEESGSEERSAALLNRPLTTGDRLWAGKDSRAELQVGSATLHLDEYTGIELQELGNDNLRVVLNEGALTVHVRDVGHAETAAIYTPNTRVSLQEPGEYSIEVNQGGDTTVVKVRDGAATVERGEQGSRVYHVDEGRQGIFTGQDRLAAAIDKVDRRSDFEQWANEREERAARSESTRYVSREVIGYEDLDEHGYWRSEPEYGHVWYPRAVAVGWAPYRYGHWAWVGPWGWTWMDDAPWGFAPFHYGRWAHVGSRWGWVPGPRAYRPVYAPALVAWVGGPSVSISASFGSGVGWFPLGPREVYVPGYRASLRHINNVNISNTVIVNTTHVRNVYRDQGHSERYAYQGRGDAMTVVSRDNFVAGRPVDRNQIRWNGRDAGNVEPNTLSPEPGRNPGRQEGASGRNGFAQQDLPRNEPAGRLPADNREGSRPGSGPVTPPRISGRADIYRPSTSTEKQDRSRGTIEPRQPRVEAPAEFYRGRPSGAASPSPDREVRGRSFESYRGAPQPQAVPEAQPSSPSQYTRGPKESGGGSEGRGGQFSEQAQKSGRRQQE